MWLEAHMHIPLSLPGSVFGYCSSSSVCYQSSHSLALACSGVPYSSPASVLPQLGTPMPGSCLLLALVPAGISTWNILFFWCQLLPLGWLVLLQAFLKETHHPFSKRSPPTSAHFPPASMNDSFSLTPFHTRLKVLWLQGCMVLTCFLILP